MGIVTKPGFYGGRFLKAGRSYDGPAAKPTQPREADQPLGRMKKPALIAEAERRGVVVKASDTKARIIAAIKAAG